MEKQNFFDLNFDQLKNFLIEKVEIDSNKAKMRAQQMFNAIYKKNITKAQISKVLDQNVCNILAPD